MANVEEKRQFEGGRSPIGIITLHDHCIVCMDNESNFKLDVYESIHNVFKDFIDYLDETKVNLNAVNHLNFFDRFLEPDDVEHFDLSIVDLQDININTQLFEFLYRNSNNLFKEQYILKLADGRLYSLPSHVITEGLHVTSFATIEDFYNNSKFLALCVMLKYLKKCQEIDLNYKFNIKDESDLNIFYYLFIVYRNYVKTFFNVIQSINLNTLDCKVIKPYTPSLHFSINVKDDKYFSLLYGVVHNKEYVFTTPTKIPNVDSFEALLFIKSILQQSDCSKTACKMVYDSFKYLYFMFTDIYSENFEILKKDAKCINYLKRLGFTNPCTI